VGYRIVKKEVFSPEIKLFEVEAPAIARKGLAGQFVIVINTEDAERIPLTIADSDRERGTITLVFQEVGKSTRDLGRFAEGQEIFDVVGPLGRPTHIEKLGTVVVIGGGLGIAPAFPIARAMRDGGNRVVSIIGSRTRDLLYWEERMRSISAELIVTTDDGSYGLHGFVTAPLARMIEEKQPLDQVVAIGPIPMMKAVCNVTRPHNIPTLASLNPIMLDGTGMCGACRITVGGKRKFVCVDGPEFDGLQVDFDELQRRNQVYAQEEKFSLEAARAREQELEKECRCAPRG
jgi:ferredoxin--NADP+ reductase